VTLNPLKLLRRKVELDERIATAMEAMAETGRSQVQLTMMQMGLMRRPTVKKEKKGGTSKLR
jgi:hypothetical protein